MDNYNIDLIDFESLQNETSASFVNFVLDKITYLKITVEDYKVWTYDGDTYLSVLRKSSGDCDLFHYYKEGYPKMTHKNVEYVEIELIYGLWKRKLDNKVAMREAEKIRRSARGLR